MGLSGKHFERFCRLFRKAKSSEMCLTHDCDGDRLRHVVALHVGGLAGVGPRPRPRHLLQHQRVLGDDHPARLVVHNLLALRGWRVRESGELITIFKGKREREEGPFFPRKKYGVGVTCHS